MASPFGLLHSSLIPAAYSRLTLLVNGTYMATARRLSFLLSEPLCGTRVPGSKTALSVIVMVLGMEPGTLCVLSKHSASELQPIPSDRLLFEWAAVREVFRLEPKLSLPH